MQRGTERGQRPIFTQPIRQIVSMVVVLVLVGIGIFVALPNVLPVFLNNPYLNGFIAFVFLVGVLACFWQVFQLMQSVSWLEGFVRDDPDLTFSAAPRLLAPLASLLRSRGREMQISATSSRSILDSVATRIDEARDITRYLVNLLIFLGLLGTFYGLATTIPAIVDTIRALAPTEGEDGMALFGRLMDGLEAQLGGMGVAFGSSLLGLAGSLVVGLLELFASHGQNRFYRELEEWLSTITKLGFAGSDADGAGEVGTSEILEHMVGQIDRLQDLFAQGEAARANTDRRLGQLAEGLALLHDRLEGEGDLSAALARVAEGQDKLGDALTDASAGTLDAESKMRLRSIDVQMLRLLEEMAAGRHETTAELRQELRQITRALGRVAG
ncbi:biopolymer transporter ExbB [Palleronia sp.]|uniref:biopolymer transporter ExbB n=1 Tax=Palleronia sp. TaxID=1940284 RepID=UPI0035C7D1FD